MAVRKGVGRPSKLTPALQKKFISILAEGNYANTACILCDISEALFYEWMKFGAAGEQPYAAFSAAVKAATAKAEKDAIKTVRKGAPGWQANAWFLERRFKGKWAKISDLGTTNTQQVLPPVVEPEITPQSDPESS